MASSARWAESIVFEPGPNNLPYLRANVAPYPNIEVVEAACSDVDGEAEFWIENLTGQNNTLVHDYKVWAVNRDRAFSREALRPITVPTVRLDSFLAQSELRPDLLKIDVEGAELMVLRGGERCLAECRPKLVVEVTENEREVDELLARIITQYSDAISASYSAAEVNRRGASGSACRPRRAHKQQGGSRLR